MRLISTIVGFLLALAIAILVFAPDRLPAGYGFAPAPVSLKVEDTIAEQIVEALFGEDTKTLVLTNSSDKPLYNVIATLRDKEGRIKKQAIRSVLPAAEQMRLGWVDGWKVEPGDLLEVKTSLYKPVEWAL
jgi:hypothetical protein